MSLAPKHALLRLALALLSLTLGALVLVPGTAKERVTTWEELIAPLRVGGEVTRGYVLAPPFRGSAGDIVFVARRDASANTSAGRVEVHVLDRGGWPGVPTTNSFSIGWEAPREGALIVATTDDANAVRDALVTAIAAHDRGLPSVQSIPLASESAAPWIVGVLDRCTGPRGWLIGSATVIGLALLTNVSGGALAAGALLFALGMALRAPALDVPFAVDQDVQRLFTGGLSVRDILTGGGLEDRHPPLYFLVLHAVQTFGQSEAVNRAPAVVCGALAGPALLLAARAMVGSVGIAAMLAGLAVTVSPVLIDQSRQVSEIPLYGLIVLAATSALVAALRESRLPRLLMIIGAHALAMYTYYLAPFMWAAHAATLWWRRAARPVVAAFIIGCLAGLPALLLGGLILLRDRGARDVARAFPGLAWGQHTPWSLATQMAGLTVDSFGLPLVLVACAAIALGIARGQWKAVPPAAVTVATFVGIALLTPIARVQDYYIATVLPVFLLAMIVAADALQGGARSLWLTALSVAVALFSIPLVGQARPLYVASGEAFMSRFAAVTATRPETTVVTVAKYDQTLLAYYLARAEGRHIGWHNITMASSKRIEGLVQVHSMHADSEAQGLHMLERIVAEGPTLVIERDSFLLPRIGERLADCELLIQAPTARLRRCVR